MKSPIIKYSFNMVEIALAMAIIAIGLSSILVLFPVGINANKSATAENNLSDIAEYMISYMRANCAKEWRLGSTSSLPATKPSIKAIAPDDLGGTSWKAVRTSEENNNSRYYYYDSTPGVLLFRQISVITEGEGANKRSIEVPEFSAIIKIWRTPLDFYLPNSSAPGLGSKETLSHSHFSEVNLNTDTNGQRYALALFLELSWPADAPEDNREKRTFRFEVFNESLEMNQL